MKKLSSHGCVDVDLFTCGKGEVLGNFMCPIYHNKFDDEFKYSWVGVFFFGNPEYTSEIYHSNSLECYC